MNPRTSEQLAHKESITDNLSVLEDASMLLGDSAHRATIAEDDYGSKWVVKSHNVSYGKAMNEVRMLEVFSREGIPTLPIQNMPIQVEKHNDNSEEATLIMPYVEDLQPLTRLDWREYTATPRYENLLKPEIVASISLAGKMHRRGYVHGDFQLKNIGYLRSGKIITYDLENAHKLEGDQSVRIQDRAADIVSLLKSLRLNGLFEKSSMGVIKDEVDELLITYVEKAKDDEAFEVADIAEQKFMNWVSDPNQINRALSRFVITAA